MPSKEPNKSDSEAVIRELVDALLSIKTHYGNTPLSISEVQNTPELDGPYSVLEAHSQVLLDRTEQYALLSNLSEVSLLSLATTLTAHFANRDKLSILNQQKQELSSDKAHSTPLVEEAKIEHQAIMAAMEKHRLADGFDKKALQKVTSLRATIDEFQLELDALRPLAPLTERLLSCFPNLDEATSDLKQKRIDLDAIVAKRTRIEQLIQALVFHQESMDLTHRLDEHAKKVQAIHNFLESHNLSPQTPLDDLGERYTGASEDYDVHWQVVLANYKQLWEQVSSDEIEFEVAKPCDMLENLRALDTEETLEDRELEKLQAQLDTLKTLQHQQTIYDYYRDLHQDKVRQKEAIYTRQQELGSEIDTLLKSNKCNHLEKWISQLNKEIEDSDISEYLEKCLEQINHNSHDSIVPYDYSMLDERITTLETECGLLSKQKEIYSQVVEELKSQIALEIAQQLKAEAYDLYTHPSMDFKIKVIDELPIKKKKRSKTRAVLDLVTRSALKDPIQKLAENYEALLSGDAKAVERILTAYKNKSEIFLGEPAAIQEKEARAITQHFNLLKLKELKTSYDSQWAPLYKAGYLTPTLAELEQLLTRLCPDYVQYNANVIEQAATLEEIDVLMAPLLTEQDSLVKKTIELTPLSSEQQFKHLQRLIEQGSLEQFKRCHELYQFNLTQEVNESNLLAILSEHKEDRNEFIDYFFAQEEVQSFLQKNAWPDLNKACKANQLVIKQHLMKEFNHLVGKKKLHEARGLLLANALHADIEDSTAKLFFKADCLEDLLNVIDSYDVDKQQSVYQRLFEKFEQSPKSMPTAIKSLLVTRLAGKYDAPNHEAILFLLARLKELTKTEKLEPLDEQGNTLFHLSIVQGNCLLVNSLLNNHFDDLTSKNNQGQTAISLLVGNLALLKDVHTHHNDLFSKTFDGESLYSLAPESEIKGYIKLESCSKCLDAIDKQDQVLAQTLFNNAHLTAKELFDHKKTQFRIPLYDMAFWTVKINNKSLYEQLPEADKDNAKQDILNTIVECCKQNSTPNALNLITSNKLTVDDLMALDNSPDSFNTLIKSIQANRVDDRITYGQARELLQVNISLPNRHELVIVDSTTKAREDLLKEIQSEAQKIIEKPNQIDNELLAENSKQKLFQLLNLAYDLEHENQFSILEEYRDLTVLEAAKKKPQNFLLAQHCPVNKSPSHRDSSSVSNTIIKQLIINNVSDIPLQKECLVLLKKGYILTQKGHKLDGQRTMESVERMVLMGMHGEGSRVNQLAADPRFTPINTHRTAWRKFVNFFKSWFSDEKSRTKTYKRWEEIHQSIVSQPNDSFFKPSQKTIIHTLDSIPENRKNYRNSYIYAENKLTYIDYKGSEYPIELQTDDLKESLEKYNSNNGQIELSQKQMANLLLLHCPQELPRLVKPHAPESLYEKDYLKPHLMGQAAAGA